MLLDASSWAGGAHLLNGAVLLCLAGHARDGLL